MEWISLGSVSTFPVVDLSLYLPPELEPAQLHTTVRLGCQTEQGKSERKKRTRFDSPRGRGGTDLGLLFRPSGAAARQRTNFRRMENFAPGREVMVSPFQRSSDLS